MCSNPYLLLELLIQYIRQYRHVTEQQLIKQREVYDLARHEHNRLILFGARFRDNETGRILMLAYDRLKLELVEMDNLDAESNEIVNTLAHLATLLQGMIH
jgi:hypothetical protein